MTGGDSPKEELWSYGPLGTGLPPSNGRDRETNCAVLAKRTFALMVIGSIRAVLVGANSSVFA